MHKLITILALAGASLAVNIAQAADGPFCRLVFCPKIPVDVPGICCETDEECCEFALAIPTIPTGKVNGETGCGDKLFGMTSSPATSTDAELSCKVYLDPTCLEIEDHIICASGMMSCILNISTSIYWCEM